MLLDDELLPKPKESSLRILVRRVYFAACYILLLWIWSKNIYLIYILQDIGSFISLGDGLKILSNNVLVSGCLFIFILLGFIKPIFLNNKIKIIGFIGIGICLYFTLGPIGTFVAEGLIELNIE